MRVLFALLERTACALPSAQRKHERSFGTRASFTQRRISVRSRARSRGGAGEPLDMVMDASLLLMWSCVSVVTLCRGCECTPIYLEAMDVCRCAVSALH